MEMDPSVSSLKGENLVNIVDQFYSESRFVIRDSIYVMYVRREL